jgi:hypothetical protein
MVETTPVDLLSLSALEFLLKELANECKVEYNGHRPDL